MSISGVNNKRYYKALRQGLDRLDYEWVDANTLVKDATAALITGPAGPAGPPGAAGGGIEVVGLGTGFDSTSIIQSALNSLTPNRIWKETVRLKGHFIITRIRIPSFTTLNCIDARLRQKGSNDPGAVGTNTRMIDNADSINGNTDIDILGGIFDGNKANQGGGGPQETRSMTVFEKCSRITLQGPAIYQNGNFHNIYFIDCPRDTKVFGITSLDARHEHISAHALNSAIDSCRNCQIIGNRIENVLAGNSFVTTLNVADAIIIGNTCYKTFDNTSGITINGLRNIVLGNTIQLADGGGIVTSQGASALFDTSNSIIACNIITDTPGYGIVIANTWPGRGLIVKSNIVNRTTETTFSGIAVQPGWQDVLVDGNIVHDCMGSGIIAYSWFAIVPLLITKNIRIVNNLCYNNGKGLQALPSNNRAGITVTDAGNAVGNILNITVENNRCYDSQAIQTQAYGIRFNFVRDSVLKNNDVRGNPTGVDIVAGDGLVAGDNIGYITEAKGATVVSDGSVINHGLAAIPTVIVANSRIAGEFVSATARTATNFTVAVRKHDNTPGTASQTIDWTALV